MKSVISTHKTRRQVRRTSQEEESAHPAGMAISPPAYGIDFADTMIENGYINSIEPIQRKRQPPYPAALEADADDKEMPLESTYDDALEKGRELWDKVQDALSGVGSAGDHDRYEQSWQEYYRSIAIERDSDIDVRTRGFADVGKAVVPDREEDPKSFPYQNIYNPRTGEIYASRNYKKRLDRAPKDSKLPNSEMLWRQYGMASEIMYPGDPSTISAAYQRLKKITRSSVVNSQTKIVTAMCYEDGETGEKTWTKQDEEFYALLGTENVKSAAYMIIDHAATMGNKTILNITTRLSGSLDDGLRGATLHIEINLGYKAGMEEISLPGTASGSSAESSEEPAPLPGPAPRKGSRTCYITTACVTARGLTDDCEELTVLRGFRDEYIRKKKNGNALVEVYYTHAPKIVEAISSQDNAREIYQELYKVIGKCVRAIKRGEYELAFQIYVWMVLLLTRKFIPTAKYPPMLESSIYTD